MQAHLGAVRVFLGSRGEGRDPLFSVEAVRETGRLRGRHPAPASAGWRRLRRFCVGRGDRLFQSGDFVIGQLREGGKLAPGR